MPHNPGTQPPNRLSQQTHDLAGPCLRGELAQQYTYLDPQPDLGSLKSLSPNAKYSRLVRIVAERAPLFIRPGELIAGAATLIEGTEHRLFDMPSISHTTLGFEPVMKLGLAGLEKKVRAQMNHVDDTGTEFLTAALDCIQSLRVWNARYLDELERRIAHDESGQREIYQTIHANMRRVPECPPASFHEALQSFWTLFAFLRILGNWSGLGRIDQILGPYLQADLETGALTIDQAREMLAHFFIRGTEWTGVNSDGFFANGSGDKQYYQNILIGGIDETGNDVTNEVSYLVLEIVEELGISDFPISVRLNKNSPERLIRKTAETIRSGGGIVAWYDEARVISALTTFGFPLADARNFTNDGCWEAIIGGKSAFSYSSFDMVLHFQKALSRTAEISQISGADTAGFDLLYKNFMDGVREEIARHCQRATSFMRDDFPCPFLSLFVESCIEKGRSYSNRGATYTINALHAGGLPDTANALVAIQKIVYEEKLMTLEEIYSAVSHNWEGKEDFRCILQKTLPRYGNDDDRADTMAQRVFNDFTEAMAKNKIVDNSYIPAGLSTFGRQIEWRQHREATADGFKKGAILSGNSSPTPGTARNGPTAVLRSAGKLDYTLLPNGCALDISLDPGLLKGETGLSALCGLIMGSLETGIFLAQVNAVDPALLRRAQKNPEQFPQLTVRVSGWSARFVTLSTDWQNMIIERLEHCGAVVPSPEICMVQPEAACQAA